MKKVVILMFVTVISAALFISCGSETESAENIDVSNVASDELESEVVLEDASEPVSEAVSEEVSEETSGEEVDYLADSVMALIDELIAKYPIENPDHIKAAVLIANLDNIEETEIEIIFNIYGYDYEMIDNLYAEYLTVLHNSIACNFAVSQGNMDEEVLAQADFLERMPITEIVLNPNGQEFALYSYECVVQSAEGNSGLSNYYESYAQEISEGTLSYADFAVIQYVGNGSGTAEYYSPYDYFGVE